MTTSAMDGHASRAPQRGPVRYTSPHRTDRQMQAMSHVLEERRPTDPPTWRALISRTIGPYVASVCYGAEGQPDRHCSLRRRHLVEAAPVLRQVRLVSTAAQRNAVRCTPTR